MLNLLLSPRAAAELIRTSGAIALDATLSPPGTSPSISPGASYLEAHLPGAGFFDIEEFSDHSSALPHMLPSPEQFARQMSALGIGNDSPLIVYEQHDLFAAPRALWTLRTMGATKVAMLDGGLRAWREAGLPLDAGEVRRCPASFIASPASRGVATLAEVRQTLRDGGQVLDARSQGRYTGASPEPRVGLSSGHMPGAISLPYTELVDGGRFKDPEGLRAIFAAKGIDFERPVTTSCGSGVTAAALALALNLSGATDVRLYDGSWAEYAQDPDSIIVKGR